MADDLLEVIASEQLGHFLADELVRGAVETVLADPGALGQVDVNRVGVGLGWEPGEEGGVEDADVRNIGQQLAGRFDAGDACRVVQRSQRRQLAQGIDDFVGDQGGIGELVTAVHGAMGHSDGRCQVGAVLIEKTENGGQCSLVVVEQLVDVVFADLADQHFVINCAGGAGRDALHDALG